MLTIGMGRALVLLTLGLVRGEEVYGCDDNADCAWQGKGNIALNLIGRRLEQTTGHCNPITRKCEFCDGDGGITNIYGHISGDDSMADPTCSGAQFWQS